MTEPPEPRRPEEGGGDEDYDAAWDGIGPDDLLDGLEDDALLDTIRDGVRGDLGPDALTELLARIRDQPDEHDPRGLHPAQPRPRRAGRERPRAARPEADQ